MEFRLSISLAILVFALGITISHGVTTDAPTLEPDEEFSPMPSEPDVEPVRGYWNYTENGEYCILCAMGIKLSFQYEGADGQVYSISYDVPANNTLDGSDVNLNGSFCDLFDRDIQRLRNRLRIHFFEPEDWILEFDFFYDYDPTDGDREWYMADIDLFYTYSKKYFPELAENINYQQQATLDRIVFFFSDLRESYWCDSRLELRDTDKFQFYPQEGAEASGPEVPQRLRIETWKTRLEAFARAPDTTFHTPNRCVEDQFIPRLVPGIVGGIVLGSIIVALSMYTVQRKAKGRDYGSGMYIENEKKSEIATDTL